MREIIIQKLHEIEKKENIRILFAAESGSRAWGLASPSSDYDVRFIYVHPIEWYLKLENKRDVIEYPVNDMLDINGWDLNKTLRLLRKSNPALFEWFASPVVYIESEFSQHFREFMREYYSVKSELAHYMSMAKGNYNAYLRGEKVKVKKYFCVLRPLLACKWIIERGSQPPMLFSELMDTQLPLEYVPILNELLDFKLNRTDVDVVLRISELNEYIENSILEIREQLNVMENDQNYDWTALNKIFIKEISAK